MKLPCFIEINCVSIPYENYVKKNLNFDNTFSTFKIIHIKVLLNEYKMMCLPKKSVVLFKNNSIVLTLFYYIF